MPPLSHGSRNLLFMCQNQLFNAWRTTSQKHSRGISCTVNMAYFGPFLLDLVKKYHILHPLMKKNRKKVFCYLSGIVFYLSGFYYFICIELSQNA